jgi:oligopeptide transport system substrate-binding protein
VIHHARTWRAVFLGAAVLAVAAFVLAACGSSGSTSTGGATGNPSQPQAGGMYNFALGAEPVYLDPVNGNYESEGTQVQHQVFQGLVKYETQPDGSMKTVPSLAESWSSNTDATVWTFKLKHGVMFQPPVSREVKAQDWIDEWNRVTDKKNGSLTSYIIAPIEGCGDDGYWTDPVKKLSGLKAIDDYTLQITLRYPFAEFPVTLGHAVAAVAPVDYITKVGPKAFNLKPLGTGPYMVDKWVPSQYVDLVKNPDFWDKANAGYVDKIHMPIFTDDQTELLEFKKGGLDYTDIPAGQIAASENAPQVKSGEWVYKKWPGQQTYFVGFNMTDKTLGYPAGDKGKALRVALSMSADREAVNNQVNEGVDTPTTVLVPPGTPGFEPKASPYGYDPTKAKQALQALGTVPTISYWFNTESTGHQKVAEVLQAGWKQLGVDIKLQGFEWGTFLAKCAKGNAGSGAQIFRMGWIADYPSMDNWMNLFETNMGKTMYTFYSSKDYDAKLKQARGTVDEAQRIALYQELEKTILTDAPIIPLYFYNNPRLTTARIAGFVYDPLGFVDMWKVWVK